MSRLKRLAIRHWFTLQMAYHGVIANPLRSALTVLSVMIGVASVITLISIGEGARAAVVDQFASLGENVIQIQAHEPTAEFRPDLAAELVDRVETIEYATPVVELDASVRWRRTRGEAAVLGVGEDFPLVRDHTLASGRFFNALHIENRAAVAVLGYDFATRLLGGRDPVGNTITINGRSFQIIGVLSPKGEGRADNIDRKIVIPYSLALQFAGERTVEKIWAKAAGRRETELAVAQLGRLFQQSLRRAFPQPGGGPDLPGEEMPPVDEIPPDPIFLEGETGGAFDGALGGEGFDAPDPIAPEPEPEPGDERDTRPADAPISVTNLNQLVEEADEANRIMTLLLGGIAAVSLLVGGIGIMNIMLVSVSERTAEIGLRKALGARRSDLLLQFIGEALILSAAGAVLGLITALAAMDIVNLFGLRTLLTPQAVTTALLAALIVGLLFGVYPAWQASGLKPVDALRRG